MHTHSWTPVHSRFRRQHLWRVIAAAVIALVAASCSSSATTELSVESEEHEDSIGTPEDALPRGTGEGQTLTILTGDTDPLPVAPAAERDESASPAARQQGQVRGPDPDTTSASERTLSSSSGPGTQTVIVLNAEQTRTSTPGEIAAAEAQALGIAQVDVPVVGGTPNTGGNTSGAVDSPTTDTAFRSGQSLNVQNEDAPAADLVESFESIDVATPDDAEVDGINEGDQEAPPEDQPDDDPTLAPPSNADADAVAEAGDAALPGELDVNSESPSATSGAEDQTAPSATGPTDTDTDTDCERTPWKRGCDGPAPHPDDLAGGSFVETAETNDSAGDERSDADTPGTDADDPSAADPTTINPSAPNPNANVPDTQVDVPQDVIDVLLTPASDDTRSADDN